MAVDQEVERLEIELLLEAISRHYGFDFRGYALGSLKRRLWQRVREEGLESLSGLQERVLHDPDCIERLLRDLSVNVTAMFRDPSFYEAFRTKVVPLLRTYPFIRIWNAGCSTGEETYSLAILLREEGLHERTRIYATDMNAGVLERAAAGTFPLDKVRDYTRNYVKARGREEFSSYYTTGGRSARFKPELAENVVFAQHSLVSDRSFNEFHAIVCRNVLIYFGEALQGQVHHLFYESLGMFGLLALGHKETIRFTPYEDCYEELDSQEKLYRRVR
jgi:chemotaxis protein methyltransferase CheR